MNTELTSSEWKQITLALQNHVITMEQHLIDTNAGDREWQDVVNYEKIITKINVILEQIND